MIISFNKPYDFGVIFIQFPSVKIAELIVVQRKYR